MGHLDSFIMTESFGSAIQDILRCGSSADKGIDKKTFKTSRKKAEIIKKAESEAIKESVERKAKKNQSIDIKIFYDALPDKLDTRERRLKKQATKGVVHLLTSIHSANGEQLDTNEE